MSPLPPGVAAGACFFFTVATTRQHAVLTDEMVRVALRRAIVAVRAARPFRIEGWVLLPDRMHAIWMLPAGDADHGARWREIKRRVTRLGAGRALATALRTAAGGRSGGAGPPPGFPALQPGSAWLGGPGAGLAILVFPPSCGRRALPAGLDGRAGGLNPAGAAESQPLVPLALFREAGQTPDAASLLSHGACLRQRTGIGGLRQPLLFFDDRSPP
ncbi:hypothetical protein ABD440_05550 [Chromobacterium piscinae]|uniref:hypothetical protein n=1 Tax=Chromobacterium piscinae TaxID=686831 RepID=UPI0031FE250F